MNLKDAIEGRNNNLNFLRMAAAYAVLVSHSFAIATGKPEAEPLRESLGITLGTISVDVFFIASGLLVSSSLLKKGDLLYFVLARVLRIYPALVVMAIFTTFFLGAAVTTEPIGEYLRSTETYKYFIRVSLVVFGVPQNLPGVFADNPYKYAVNGSLWTLPYEIKMYEILVVIWLCGKLTSRHVTSRHVTSR
jgi:peptidoglycan/LPS O-acetylase OafA/YrhL